MLCLALKPDWKASSTSLLAKKELRWDKTTFSKKKFKNEAALKLAGNSWNQKMSRADFLRRGWMTACLRQEDKIPRERLQFTIDVILGPIKSAVTPSNLKAKHPNWQLDWAMIWLISVDETRSNSSKVLTVTAVCYLVKSRTLDIIFVVFSEKTLKNFSQHSVEGGIVTAFGLRNPLIVWNEFWGEFECCDIILEK